MNVKTKLAIRSLVVLANNLLFDYAVDGKIDDPDTAAATLEQIADQIRASAWKPGTNEAAKNQIM